MSADWRWWESAPCRGIPIEQFYPPRGDKRPGPQAVAACEACPHAIKAACLEETMDLSKHADEAGYRAGMTPDQRAALRQRRRRGLPGTDPETARRRLRAHELRRLGWPNDRIPDLLNVDRRTVARYMAAACGAAGCWCERRAAG